MLRLVAIVLGCAAAAATGLALASPSDPARRTQAPPPRDDAPLLDCRDRITGAITIIDGVTRPYRFRVRPAHDTRIGPLALAGARDYGRPGQWKAMVRDDQWLKTPALVRRGARVRLEIPVEQRGWMRSAFAHGAEGARFGVTIQGCRRPATRAECGPGPRETCRSRVTPFSGGFEIDYARAPRQGRCAELIVHTRERTLRKRLYGDAC